MGGVCSEKNSHVWAQDAWIGGWGWGQPNLGNAFILGSYGPAAPPLVRLFTYLLAPHLLSRTAPSEDSVSLSEVDVMFDSVCAMGSSLKV